MESEFFGYEKGAFSGADCKGKKGCLKWPIKAPFFSMNLVKCRWAYRLNYCAYFRMAGSVALAGRKLFRLMSHYCGNQRQSGRYGGTTSAARRSLLPHQCTFLTIPPLRERPQDISLLIRHFVQKYAKEFQRRIILDKACFDALHHHSWPGNVRELENTIIRLMLMAESDVITPEELGW
jgi:hypothetical protein